MHRRWAVALAIFLCANAAPSSLSRVAAIQSRGTLHCGLAPNVPGFSVVRDDRHATGLDADLCRATAVTILGSADAARFVPLETVDQFLADDTIDIVFHGLTWKVERERRWGVAFTAVSFQDGQAFAVPRREAITHAAALDGRTVCVEAATIFAAAVRRALPRARILALPDAVAAEQAFRAGRCDAWSWDASSLFSALSRADGDEFRILPERLSHEPLAPIVRAGDSDLAALFRWTMAVLLGGEGGDAMPAPPQGIDVERGAAILAATGDYAAIYARNLEGAGQPAMDRGANRLVRNDGLMDPKKAGGPE